VIVGLNRVYEHDGRQLHIQVEDLGEEQACFEVRVYQGGTVLWHRRVDYSETLRQGLARLELEDALRAQMEKTLHTVQAAISRGKLF